MLVRSARTVLDSPLLVLLMACTTLYVTCHSTPLFLWISLVVSIILTPAIYGRFAQVMTNERPSALFRLFARHGFNFYVVVALFFVPVVITAFWARKDLATAVMNIGFAVAQVLLIYILPGVFLMRSPVEAITSGLAFLGKNVLPSLPLIGLALFNPLLHLAIPSAWIALDLSSVRAAARTLPLALLYNIALSAVTLTLFVAAGRTLRGIPHDERSSNAN
ncbi:MAG: hypothetical protein OEW15_03860 [Nitrospirota bacterium]|nr:hypothetical protein [Nitrospirota bacterium]